MDRSSLPVKLPRILISAPSGKSGKTSVTLGLIRALKKEGLKVQPFKVGPDFIDPSYHTFISGRTCRNLDSYMFSRDVLLWSLARNSRDADIAVIEGFFGFYDSPDGVSERGSTAEVSKLLKTPVILVLNAERINRGLAAIAKGMVSFDREAPIKGVIVNNVAGERQERKIRRIFRELVPEVELLGVVMRSKTVEEVMRYRHLGLIPVAERSRELEKLVEVSERTSERLDLDRIKEIAFEAPEIDLPDVREPNVTFDVDVAVVMDEAFSFYYPENIEFLQRHARRVLYVDAIRDDGLPEVDLLYIGGGFPEVYAPLLEENEGFRRSVLREHERGMKIYAECGGLMYSCSRLRTDRSYEMLGLVDAEVVMQRKPVGHGYTHLRAIRRNLLCEAGKEIVGHEFHHSKLLLEEDVEFAFKMLRGYGVDGSHDGIMKENLLCNYTHLHVLNDFSLFENLLSSTQR